MPGFPLQAIVGLGNPGSKYDKTRHNLGFRVVDELASRWKANVDSKKHKSLVGEVEKFSTRLTLIKPQTYMNLSGEAVGEMARFFKWPPENILVLSDDLDIPDGAIRIRPFGGAGGHNGLKSLIEHLGTDKFPRIRIGIGRDPVIPADAYVLATIPGSRADFYKELVTRTADAVVSILEEGLEKAMTRFHASPKELEKKLPEKKESKP